MTYEPERTSKIKELVDLYNSTNYYVAEHFVNFSPIMMMKYLMKNSRKIEDIIVIRKKKYDKNDINIKLNKAMYLFLCMLGGFTSFSIVFLSFFKYDYALSNDMMSVLLVILFIISWVMTSIFTIGLIYSIFNLNKYFYVRKTKW